FPISLANSLNGRGFPQVEPLSRRLSTWRSAKPSSRKLRERRRHGETHLSAQQAHPEAPSRLSRTHGDEGRTQGAEAAPRPQPPQALGLTQSRAGFLAISEG